MIFETLENPQPSPQSTDGRHTILLVDDDEAMVDALSRRLRQQGFDTAATDSGQTALAMARSDRPALILLDLRLPDSDGMTICRELADSPQTCDIPVIILSGLDQPDIIRRARAAGCQFFIRKPYDPNALLVLIQYAIEATSDWDEDWS